jgi:hypothetical protein
LILAAPNKSHHEPFSDTIFWTCTVKFVYRSHQTKLAIDQESKDDEKAANLAISFPLVDYGMDEEEEEGGEEMEEEESKTTNDSNGINLRILMEFVLYKGMKMTMMKMMRNIMMRMMKKISSSSFSLSSSSFPS